MRCPVNGVVLGSRVSRTYRSPMHTAQSQSTLATLRDDPDEWYRRGLTPPHVIAAFVDERLRAGNTSAAEPSYADFFTGADA